MVIGGSGGLGQFFVRALLEARRKVVATFHRNEERATELVAKMRTLGGDVSAYRLDATNEGDVERLFGRIASEHGQFGALVNALGIRADALVCRMTADQWELSLRTNLTAVFNSCKHAIPHLRGALDPNIVNITSTLSSTGMLGAANYASSKAGVIGFSRSLVPEVAPFRIRVNCIALGYFDAGMGSVLPARLRERVVQSIPLKRFGSPEEASSVLVFLVSPAASYINGQVITVDGGLT